MATLSLIFPIGTVPSGITLDSLAGSPAATTSLPKAFTGPVTLGDGRNEWTVTFAGAAVSYAYSATATIAAVPASFSGVVAGDGASAVGTIIDQTTLTAFLGALDLAILSQQDNSATTVNSPTVQGVITMAESVVYSILLQLRCRSGTFFAYPFTVGGVAIKSSGSLIALPVLQEVCHQIAAFDLNRWRMVMSTSEDTESTGAVNAMAKRWRDRAEETLRKIIRWAQGYTDGQYVELDLNAGAVVGQIYQVVQAPVFAGATVDHNGLPERKIINPAGVPWPGAIGLNPWQYLSE